MNFKQYIKDTYEDELRQEFDSQNEDGARWESVSQMLDFADDNALAEYVQIDLTELQDEYRSFLEDCTHEDVDDNLCLVCGTDLTETYIVNLEQQAKDFRKYGDF